MFHSFNKNYLLLKSLQSESYDIVHTISFYKIVFYIITEYYIIKLNFD